MSAKFLLGLTNLFIILFFPFICSASEYIGFKRIHYDIQDGRPLAIAVWYPTNHNHDAVTIAENVIFYGHEVTPDAETKISTTKYPLVLLSHGSGGSWQNLSLLANKLTLKGYIVAAPNHPRTTIFDRNIE